MIGTSAANARILVMANAVRPLRSALVAQVSTTGPTLGSPLLWMTSMTFCEMPIILFTDLNGTEMMCDTNGENVFGHSADSRFYWPRFRLHNSYLMRFIRIGRSHFDGSFNGVRKILFCQYCYRVVTKCCVNIQLFWEKMVLRLRNQARNSNRYVPHRLRCERKTVLTSSAVIKLTTNFDFCDQIMHQKSLIVLNVGASANMK